MVTDLSVGVVFQFAYFQLRNQVRPRKAHCRMEQIPFAPVFHNGVGVVQPTTESGLLPDR